MIDNERILHFRDGTVATIRGSGNPQWSGWPSQARIQFIQEYFYFDAANQFGFGCGQIIDCRRRFSLDHEPDDQPVPILEPTP